MSNEKKELKKISLFRIISPLLTYYLASVIAQCIYMVRKVPGYVIEFATGNTELIEVIGEDISDLSETEALTIFAENLPNIANESIYWDFVNLLLDKAIDHIGYITILTALVGIPLLMIMMVRDYKKQYVLPINTNRTILYKVIYVMFGCVCLCIALNATIFMMMSKIDTQVYQTTSEALYSIRFRYQLIGYGLLVPIVEELLYRGLIYNRLKVSFGRHSSLVISAIIFAMVHGNWVQGLYGLICGLVFVWLYEFFGTIFVPILAHMTLNISSLFFTKYEIFDIILRDDITQGIGIVTFSTLVSLIYVILVGNKKNIDI